MLFEAGGQPMSAQEPRGLSSSHWAAVIELRLSARAVCRIIVLEVIWSGRFARYGQQHGCLSLYKHR